MQSSWKKLVVAGLAVGLVTGSLAWGSGSAPKKKKQQDLSANPLANVKSKQPDKELFDKAMVAMKKGRYDVARLDLQTMLNTYPESEFQMRAKLAIGDSWFKEGGTAALTQAEAEYKDFITFFPDKPEAAEAQMKVADIYFMQMDKPDRDHTNAEKAEREYRNMILQFPDSTLVPRARQRLREVQEVLAAREFEIGTFYLTHENWSAMIARLSTVHDQYPLFSRSDETLIGIGDAYAAEAHMVDMAPNMKPEQRKKLAGLYRQEATAAYAQVISRYPMAPHVEDARDRLIALSAPVPEPTQEAIARNDAEEKSRQQLRVTDHIFSMVKHGPTTLEAAHVGEPTLTDPKRTYAPDVNKKNVAILNSVFNPDAATKTKTVAEGKPDTATEAPRSDNTGAPLKFEEVPTDGTTAIGAVVVSAPKKKASDSTAPTYDRGIGKFGGSNPAELPPVEKPEVSPDQVNAVTPGSTPAPTTDANKKKDKFDGSDESSSKHKKKKGLEKLNPIP
jgi:outer membrane protein assembly factor BamD